MWASEELNEAYMDLTLEHIIKRKRTTNGAPHSLISTCNPNDIHKIVNNLFESKEIVVNAIRFISLLRIGCLILIEHICKMMVDNIDIELQVGLRM